MNPLTAWVVACWTDSRVRLVVPTEQALRYFAEHAKVIQQAAK